MTWSAQQYVAFEAERTRPVRDLLAALPPIQARTVIDLGCGPGNSTELLAARFPSADVTAIDSSPDMIDAARARLPHISVTLDGIEHWLYLGSSGFDVILANAVLHWLPHHAKLFPALIARLVPGGALAVQMPDNLEEPSHRLMREIARDGPWAGKITSAAAARTSIAAVDWYYELLLSCGCTVDIWRTTYHHRLAGGAPAIVEWFKGSGLRPFIDPLDADERAHFLRRYQAAVSRAYPTLPDGSALLPFPRLFIVAVR